MHTSPVRKHCSLQSQSAPQMPTSPNTASPGGDRMVPNRQTLSGFGVEPSQPQPASDCESTHNDSQMPWFLSLPASQKPWHGSAAVPFGGVQTAPCGKPVGLVVVHMPVAKSQYSLSPQSKSPAQS